MSRIIGIIFILSAGYLHAQYFFVPENPKQVLQNHIGAYDRGGMKNTGEMVVDGNENIDPYSGNVIVNFSSTVNLPNELAGALTITFNSNVTSTSFLSYNYFSQYVSTSGYNYNIPEWIIGFHGLAIQTLSFYQNFYDQSLLPGYHFTNPIGSMRNEEWLDHLGRPEPGWYSNYFITPREGGLPDCISLLTSDGSILKLLKNTDYLMPGDNNNIDRYGQYIAFSGTGAGYADVKAISISAGQPFHNEGLRRMKYSPGDGLVYLFNERYVNYSDRGREKLDQPSYVYNWLNLRYYTNSNFYDDFPGIKERRTAREPRIMYLDTIATVYGDTLCFEYMTDSEFNAFSAMHGRRPLKKINYKKGYDQTIYTVLEIIYDLNSSPSKVTIKTNDELTCEMNAQNSKYYISSIKNKANLKTDIEYLESSRSYEITNSPIGIPNHLYTFFANINLISKVKYFNGKSSEFEYYDSEFTNEQPYPSGYQYDLCWDPTPIYDTKNEPSKRNFLKTWRDNYSMYMLKKKTVKSENSPVFSEEYKYGWDKPTSITSYDPFMPKIENIWTTVTKNNLTTEQNSVTSQSVEKKFFYNAYSVRVKRIGVDWSGFVEDFAAAPFQKSVKLMRELTTESPQSTVEKKFSYYISADPFEQSPGNTYYKPGYTNNKYYFGYLDQRIGEVLDIEVKAETTLVNGLVKDIITYERSREQSSTNWLPEARSPLMSQYSKDWEKKTDLKGTCIENRYESQYFEEDDYSLRVLSFAAPTYESVKSGSTIKYEKQNLYDNMFIPNVGVKTIPKIKKTTYTSGTVLPPGTRRTVTVDYTYKSAPELKGLPDETIYSTGLTKKFYYPSELNNTVSANVFYTSSSSVRNNFSHTGCSFLPLKVNYLFGNKTLSYYISFDKRGNPNFIVDPNEVYTSFEYDAIGRTTKVHLPGSFTGNGNTVSYDSKTIVYDDANRKKTISEYCSATQTKVSRETYDIFDNLVLRSIKNDAGVFEDKNEFAYNYLNFKIMAKDGLGREKQFKYDCFGRLLETLYDDNSKILSSYSYSLGGDGRFIEAIETLDNENIWHKTVTDGFGRKLEDIGKENTTVYASTVFSYDELDRINSVQTPAGRNTTYQYDDLGNVSKKDHADIGIWLSKYDKSNNLRYSMNQNSTRLLVNVYDNLNRKLSTSVVNNFNPSGFAALDPDVTGIFDADTSLQVQVNRYDDDITFNGVFSGLYWCNGIAPSNTKGNLVMSAFRDKPLDGWNYKVYSYDGNGAINSYYVKYSTYAWKQIHKSFDHLGNNNILRMNWEHDFIFNYDNQGRLKRTSSAQYAYGPNTEAEYSYYADDMLSNVKNYSYSSALNNVNYVYSPLRGWLSSISETSGKFYETLGYYNNANIRTISSGGTIPATWPQHSMEYLYDSRNRLSAMSTNLFGEELFCYDKDGNLTYKANGTDNLVYNYNHYPQGAAQPSNRLTSVTNFGNSFAFTYDAEGNIISDQLNQINSVTYDYRNLPLTVTKSGSIDYYRYDDNGLRIGKYNYNNGVLSNAEYYLRDVDGTELAVYNISQDRLKEVNLYGHGLIGKITVDWDYIWVPDQCSPEGNGDEEAYSDRSQGYYYWQRTDHRNFYLKDHLGSIRVVTDASGNIISAKDYSPFGGISRAFTGASSNMRYQFTGKERDVPTSYDYFGARFYSSRLGRWLSADPLAQKFPGWSPYNYCVNNPINATDPNGLFVDFGGDALLEELHNQYYNEKDDKGNYKYEAYRKAFDKLHSSSRVYKVSFGDPKTQEGGRLSYDGTNFTITLMTSHAQSLITRMAHEFQHGVQFENGELGYFSNNGGKTWQAFNYDITDEVDAWDASLTVAPFCDYHDNSGRSLLGKYSDKTPDKKSAFLKTIGYSGLPGDAKNNVLIESNDLYIINFNVDKGKWKAVYNEWKGK